ncbi:MAG: hypothetical protein R3D56_14905 [Paracoccaceae bacterium]
MDTVRLEMNLLVKLPSWSVTTAVALLLTACVASESAPPSPPVPTEPVPQEIIDFAFKAATAKEIAGSCRQGFRYNKAYEDAVIAGYEAKYGRNPAWARGDLSKAVKPKAAQDWAIKYIQRRDIVLADARTWCAAGQKEVAEKTLIGRLLIAR